MKSHDFFMLCLQLAALLSCALATGTLMRRLKQPAVVGEMAVGLLLGPTLFGAL